MVIGFACDDIRLKAQVLGIDYTKFTPGWDAMFMTDDELAKFSNCYSREGQIYWLKLSKVRHLVNANGRHIVARSVAKPSKIKNYFYGESDLLKKVSFPRIGVGIYFLISQDQVVYVGKTTNFFARMASHTSGEKDFDRIAFVAVAASNLDIFEREYIARFRPKFNVTHNPAAKCSLVDAIVTG